MNTRHHRLPCLLLASLSLLSACSSRPDYTRTGPSYVKPGLIMLTPDQAEKHGVRLETCGNTVPKEASGLDASAVLSDPGVKVYSIGRYEDPDDPNLMHEAHLVYRRENGPRWRLQASPANQVLVGPRITATNPDSTPLRTRELEAGLQELRKENEANRRLIEQLRSELARQK